MKTELELGSGSQWTTLKIVAETEFEWEVLKQFSLARGENNLEVSAYLVSPHGQLEIFQRSGDAVDHIKYRRPPRLSGGGLGDCQPEIDDSDEVRELM